MLGQLTESLLKRAIGWGFVYAAIPAAPLWAGDLEHARQLYQRTEYEAAWQALGVQGSEDARVLLLAGQIDYQRGRYEDALERLERASQLEPRSAEISLWLGRSLGQRAKTAPYISLTETTAYGYARRCREALERAVELDAKHVAGLYDLASYYVKAPSVLGGDPEKAEQLAGHILALDPVQGQYIRVQMAVQRGKFALAEEHLQRVANIAPDSPRLLFTRAELYIQQKRNLQEARALLRRYLQMQLTPEDPPRREAEWLLAEADG
jgi:tetratricopeptide (TPR) repeat protein